MKLTNFLPIVMIAAAGLVASCSTSKLASTSQNDDVYNTVAKAREVEIIPQQQQYSQNQDNDQNQDGYDEYYGTSNPYYDMDYSSRINRFSNGASWRGYYDPYYDNFAYGNSYGATNFLGYGGLGWSSGYGLGGWGGGFGLGFGYGYGSIWNNPFYYGNMGFGWNNWGPYSYYDRFGWGGGWYGGGWGYGGGFYGGGVYTGNSNYRARPGNTLSSRGYGNNNGVGNSGRPNRSGVGPQNGASRQGYAPNFNSGRPTRSQANGNGQSGGYSRPDVNSSRPGRNENYAPQPQRTESRPTYSPPPTSRGSSGGGSYGGGGGGGSRPSRGGRG